MNGRDDIRMAEDRPITKKEFEEIVHREISLANAQLELRLTDKFALKAQVDTISSSMQLLHDQAVLKGGPIDSMIKGHEGRLQKVEDWKTRMTGLALIIGPVFTITLGVVADRVFLA